MIEPQACNPITGFVRGQWYRVSALGSTFEFWVPRRLHRSELRPVALRFIGPDVYAPNEIDSVRAIREPDYN